MRVLRLPGWHLSFGEWRYYGWRIGLRLGPVLILMGRAAA